MASNGRVRLVDVAERAGVSMKTVSNVVNGYAHVQPETRARVQLAIDELGYRPNLTARRLATGKTGMIALAMPEIDHPYFGELARHVAEIASSRGYRVIIEQTLGDEAAERAVLRDREAGLVDGVIFQPVRIATLEIARLHRDLPLVLLGEVEAPVTTDHVMIDNVRAAADVTDHLLAGGRTRIGFLGMVEGDITMTNNRRLLGYQEALIRAGLPLDPRRMLTVGGFAPEDAAEAVRGALTDGPEFDALVCRDDRFAAGALAALREHGASVPDDVAVVGWDDSALAEWTWPALSSLAPDKHELARVAFDLLSERMNGVTGVGRHRIVPHSVHARASAPPA
ncbi:LacI family DNA-binding transcriptional regulator [Myceligenerans pegani]|uniref:LacI family DNA-binding transcriptional regulator n=1 Tax=Myceligenerans pegani TaxID=2776917 RepID=A0ABR9N409_9MICO|nr:LacI family DNA-binding transcriptional regulator [Myceligenerans sp. TRM 65318]MBE1878400.1 LacI family DNA-binding transcriptional regulator [Myceligenerans sp. TRM 65318]MBE3020671.1 LacI family DNA-binding transcriptional regulator [Myceligenerans sp. TRM 65318]